MKAMLAPARSAQEVHGDVDELLAAVGHQVAAAFEAGGTTWQLAAPLLRGLVPDDLLDAPAVVVTRAAGLALRRRAAAVERSRCEGDLAVPDDVAAQLRQAHRRLVGLLADG